jgi:hypothetical protein
LIYGLPALALFIAEGTVVLLAALAAMPRWSALARLGTLALALLLLASPGQALIRLAVWWPRADCDLAADYVLARRRPDEGIAGNHWESAYYFRHLGSAFTLLEGTPHPLPDQLWLVATAASWSDRRDLAEQLIRDGWQPQEQREFARTTVFFLRKHR